MNQIYLEYDVRKYFERIISLKDKTVVDWGCNHGNMLKYTECDFNYIGLDIDQSLIDKNKKKWPQHKWIHLDSHNHQYNQTGKEDWIDIEADIVLMFSIFTHMPVLKMKKYIKKIKTPLLTTFIPSNDEHMLKKALSYRLNHRPDVFEKVYDSEYSYVVATPEDVVVYQSIEDIPKLSNVWYFLSIHHTEYMQKFGDVIETNYDNGIESTQHCLYKK